MESFKPQRISDPSTKKRVSLLETVAQGDGTRGISPLLTLLPSVNTECVHCYCLTDEFEVFKLLLEKPSSLENPGSIW
jgi:hypothetical protein